MAKTRSMSTALDASTVVDFIEQGVPTTETIKQEVTDSKTMRQSDGRNAGRPNPKRLKHERTKVRDSTDFKRTLSKARIQKSIRFRPELIARLDTYCRKLEAEGQEAISNQRAQNEALEMWLESKKA